MKKIFFLLLSGLLCLGMHAQSVIGAWEATLTKDGKQLKNVVVFTNGYQVSTWYDANTGEFIKTSGGAWFLKGNMMTETVEFDSENAEYVGEKVSFQVSILNNTLEIFDKKIKLKRIDNGTPGHLQGAWLMSGRVRNGETQSRDTSRPRKTMKILSGTRFQWIAYNTETKQFMGTGGGTYTTANGKYTENIEFFSKDVSRVGMSLEFNFSLIDGDWQHTGFTSKGDPLHEIWSVRKK